MARRLTFRVCWQAMRFGLFFQVPESAGRAHAERYAEAAASYREALGLVGNEAERRHLEKRLRDVTT